MTINFKKNIKMKKLLIAVMLFCTIGMSEAQTYIKSNALYWLGLLPNVGVETRLGKHFTFNGEFNASLWESINGRPYMGMQAIAGVRYYPKMAFKGFYVGADAAFDVYNVSKWDHPATDVQHGIGIYLGVTLGYQISIAKRWNMDFYAGGGWHLGHYWGEDKLTDTPYALWNASGEWIPYKLGVTFAYRLTSNKRMQRIAQGGR